MRAASTPAWVTCSPATGPNCPTGRAVHLMVRPEAVRLDGTADNRVAARVVEVAFAGAMFELTARRRRHPPEGEAAEPSPRCWVGGGHGADGQFRCCRRAAGHRMNARPGQALRAAWAAAVWLPPLLLIAAPLAIFVAYSFFRVDGNAIVHEPGLANYARFFGDGVFLPVFHAPACWPPRWRDHARARLSGARSGWPRWRAAASYVFMLVFAVPLLMSYIIKIYAIRAILGGQGLLNRLLLWTRPDHRRRSRVPVQPDCGPDHPLDAAAAVHHPADLRRAGAHPAQPLSKPRPISAAAPGRPSAA